MFQTKVAEKIKTRFFVRKPPPENRAVDGAMWENIVEEPGRRQMTMWGINIACWIPKSKNTHSEYVILIAFVLQQWLQELV